MKFTEPEFETTTSNEVREEILNLVEGASRLEEIIDRWVVPKRGYFGLGQAISDGDDKPIPGYVVLFFDDLQGRPLGWVSVLKEDLAAYRADTKDLDVFLIKKPGKPGHVMDFDDKKFDDWAKQIGLTDSFALMSRIGPREAIAKLIGTFGLSPWGTLQVMPVDPHIISDEDYAADLTEEGIDIGEYIAVQPSFCHSINLEMGAVRSIFDAIYCRKE